MANTPSAHKRNRQNARRRERNRAARSRLRTAVRKLRGAVAGGNKEAAAELLAPTVSLLDSTAGKGIIHPNAAARTKSRLTRSVAKLG
jgi:small subunit ribosomal protein S20